VVLASSHLILVTSEAVIGGVCEFTSVLVTRGAVIGGAREFTSVVSYKCSCNWWFLRVHICCY
jgi:hypothetical protein